MSAGQPGESKQRNGDERGGDNSSISSLSTLVIGRYMRSNQNTQRGEGGIEIQGKKEELGSPSFSA